MNKKKVLKIAGCVLGGIVLILSVAGFVLYKTTLSPMLAIYQNGHPTIFSDDDADVYYCKNEIEETAVILKNSMDKYGKEFYKETVKMAFAQKQELDSGTLDGLYSILLLQTSLTSVEPGYYIFYDKNSSECMVFFIQYDKKLRKKLGTCKAALSSDESWIQEFSI